MHRMLRRIVVVAAVVVVLILVIGVVIVMNLDALVETGVEKGGTFVLGVPTELDNASISLLGGTVGLDGLTLGSPEGFDAPEMFRLGHAHTEVELGSLRREEIVVHEVVVDGAEVTLEFSEGKTNWGALMQRLRSEPSEREKKSERKIRVDRIVFSNARIRLAGIPVAGTASIPLPDLEIKDLRTADGRGVTVRKALASVVESLYTSALDAVKGSIPTEELKKLEHELRSVLGEAGDVAGEARSAAEEAVKDVTDTAKGVFEGILGGKENRER